MIRQIYWELIRWRKREKQERRAGRTSPRQQRVMSERSWTQFRTTDSCSTDLCECHRKKQFQEPCIAEKDENPNRCHVYFSIQIWMGQRNFHRPHAFVLPPNLRGGNCLMRHHYSFIYEPSFFDLYIYLFYCRLVYNKCVLELIKFLLLQIMRNMRRWQKLII